MDREEPSSIAFRAHRRVLFPVLGLLWTGLQLRSTTSHADRIVLRAAARWQGLGALIILMHLTLQVGVELVRWMATSGPGLSPAFDALVPPVLLVCTTLNVLSGGVEYAFVLFWGLRASRGTDLPFLAKNEET